MKTQQFFARPEFLKRPERASHSLATGIPGGGELQRLADTATWEERLDVPRGHPRARARRARELRRALPADGPAARVVVLRYADGTADLLLVAHRARLERSAMIRMARALTGAEPGGMPTPAPPPAVAAGGPVPPDSAEPALAFGLPGLASAGRYGQVVLPGLDGMAPDPVLLVAAVAVVHHRYQMGETAPIGLVDCDRETLGVVAPDIAGDHTIAVVRKAVATQLANEPPEAAALPSLGVVFARRAPGVRYQPAMAPVFRMTLCWEIRPDGGSVARCHYDEAFLSPAIAAEFARCVSRVARQMLERPDSMAVADLELMTDDRTALVLAAGRTPRPAAEADTFTAYPNIHEAFETIARRQPHASACSENGVRLTYRDLYLRSERLAAGLASLGARPGARVGVCLDRGIDLVTVLLAVLRTGAAYVPMDVRAPADRLAFTATDAGVIAVITDLAEFPALVGAPVVSPSELAPATGAGPDIVGTAARPGDTAYVIYTSGSTGRPKGVLIPHRNVLALLAATAPEMNLAPTDVWTQFHSGAFDFSVWEIWGCLLTGGHLVCVPHWVSRSPEEFRALLVSHRVTVLSQTPSAFAQLDAADAEAGGEQGELAVRLVVFGGEPLVVAGLGDWLDRHRYSRCRLVNMYGITETTVHVTAQTITPAEIARRSRSVGAALPGWAVSVRDERGRPLPFGARGEICVAGAGVADGYLNRDELTAERFVPDAFGQEVLYRSGDSGRLLPDGRLQHLGRLDNQVQLRGFRIELDEIRSVLQEIPGISAAVVVLAAGPGGDPALARLDAYVTGGGYTTAEIRGLVARKLPDHMVPSTVTRLDELPMTPNGKVDIAGLPAPVSAAREHPPGLGDRPGSRPGEEQPTDAAAVMVRIWSSLFETAVTPEDDFFELGGNSLLAARVSAALRAAGLPAFSVRDLYRHPTIAALVTLVPRGAAGK
ncbi:non-ribosomal peptide synthetase [Streptomyces litchfieldiae]|uniref:Non-ribosomal peptide synthetase n=1 Tax=Streptomyces litchfieldiae TaxID=3075543 RepID=A0ABU2MQY0_9ACTN|nr:non-ribosomal peptide synthetase [Streptomyces sp. DSM 44938]MDT0343920.1 non-ribosomal peptide synthetase [Streptomyces sp. DSM 44938]